LGTGEYDRKKKIALDKGVSKDANVREAYLIPNFK
jgi:hypothetical protein